MIIPDEIKNIRETYQLKEFSAMLDRINIRDKNILEIGCDRHLTSARLFKANGANSVLSTNLVENYVDTSYLSEGIEAQVCDVSNVDITLGSIDVIYGIAVLEHIADLDEVCQALKAYLKPDGLIYLQGYPLWTGPLGHHVWYQPPSDESATPYHFNSKDNPIPDWSHLVLSPKEMQSLLVTNGIPTEHAEGIVWHVYNTDGTRTGSSSNFRAPSELLGIIHRYFDIDIERNICYNKPNEYYNKALEIYTEGDLKTMGLRLLMRHIPQPQTTNPTNITRS